jgi:hypothetical protein
LRSGSCPNDNEETWSKCDFSCGAPGLPCCEDDYEPCNGGGLCDGEYCVADATPGCGEGEEHFVYFVDSSSCASLSLTFLATAGNEQSCAEANTPPGYTAGTVDVNPTCEEVCVNPNNINQPTTYGLCWFSDEAYNTCAKSFCAFEDECTWSQNACP